METRKGEKSFRSGEVIIRQGDKGSFAYIIEEGQVEIIIEHPDGGQNLLGTRGPGSIIGEMAIVDDAPRTATVRAVEDCRLLEISRENFAARLRETDPVVQAVSRVILARYRDMLTRARILHESNALLPIESAEHDHVSTTDLIESVKLSNEFKRALAKRELRLHYQPIIDLAEGNVVGFEALMRWPHPELGFVSPSVFIPVAEKGGFITEATRWALEEATCALERVERELGNKGCLYVSVNFSSADFTDEALFHTIKDHVNRSGISPAQMNIEITERLLIDHPDKARVTLERCRDEGFAVSIDDFGTGYSSLSYLHFFPIDTLKIDQIFIRSMRHDERNMELVRSIVSLGKNLGMIVVAEGVEEIEDARILQKMNCDAGQGYCFARPMPEGDLIDILRGWNADTYRRLS